MAFLNTFIGLTLKNLSFCGANTLQARDQVRAPIIQAGVYATAAEASIQDSSLREKDYDLAATLLPLLERKVGRSLCNGFPTGAEVSHTNRE